MTTRTVWTRLEPWPRDEDLRAGLEARVHDPLWLLGRQWQLGEFAAEDAASPVRVSADLSVTPGSAYAPSAAASGATLTGVPYDPRSTPLEAVVEAEPVVAAEQPSWVLAARAGLDLLDVLLATLPATATQARADATAALLRAHPIPAPSAADIGRWGGDRLRGWTLLAARAPHGGTMLALVAREGVAALLQQLGMDPASAPALAAPVASWVATYQLLLQPAARPSAWAAERLQYGFSVGVGSGANQLVLAAADHDGGRLDWTSFDVAERAAIRTSTAPANAAPTSKTIQALASGVQFPGMPNRRYWELEDGAVNLGAIDASSVDLTRLLFLQFGLLYGNDFFMVPVSVPVGSSCVTTRFTVVDTFGEQHPVSQANLAAGSSTQDTWRMFALSGGRAGDSILWLPACLPTSYEGPRLEHVRFARDEAANVTWGIETMVEGPTGRGVPRRDLEARPPVTEPPPNPDTALDVLDYRLAAVPPASWIPLEPLVPRRATDPVNALVSPSGAAWGRILGGIAATRLFGEAVPREGVEVARRFEHARWLDGRHVLWLGRTRSPGRGEVDSGLRFDFAAELRRDTT